MIFEQIIILGFSLFLFTGAYFGVKAKSKISLIMGIAAGTLILIGDLILRFNQKAGLTFLMVIAGLLIVSFVQRVLKTKKMMPAGMLLITSILFFTFILFKFLNL